MSSTFVSQNLVVVARLDRLFVGRSFARNLLLLTIHGSSDSLYTSGMLALQDPDRDPIPRKKGAQHLSRESRPGPSLIPGYYFRVAPRAGVELMNCRKGAESSTTRTRTEDKFRPLSLHTIFTVH